eukprot:m.156148 g.156148  ORF g.156148 m.156148 type:complete len:83 (+) comp30977_c0_seq1:2199-2447(+)
MLLVVFEFDSTQANCVIDLVSIRCNKVFGFDGNLVHRVPASNNDTGPIRSCVAILWLLHRRATSPEPVVISAYITETRSLAS